VTGVTIEGREIAVYTIGGRFFATANICTHAYALLSHGFLEDGVIECPIHSGRFDVASGCALGPPVTKNLLTYPVRVDGEDVLVGLDGERE
jgi:nitrite reductase/ring-hydroxylating ferredoxin subunit